MKAFLNAKHNDDHLKNIRGRTQLLSQKPVLARPVVSFISNNAELICFLGLRAFECHFVSAR